jgi:CDP-diacylglycerol---glycerol-3-phosphate 3-phosphatidyltransferase
MFRKLKRPNVLTVMRIVLIVPLCLVFHSQQVGALWASLGLLAMMGLTDLLDGYFARKYNVAHREGELMDSMADGFVRLSVFLLLLADGLVPLWMVLLVMWRDLVSWSLRFMDLARGNDQVHKRISGKINGLIQSVAIGGILIALLWAASVSHPINLMVVQLFMLSAVLTAVWSTVDLLYTHKQAVKTFLRR